MNTLIEFQTRTGNDKVDAWHRMSWPLAADAHLRGLCAPRVARPR
jgi:hypothetical protein